MANSQGKATQAFLAGNVGAVLVGYGTGTTSGTINTAALVAHGVADFNGNPYPAANLRVNAQPTSSAGNVYRSAATTATQIDIRSAVASVPYEYFIYLIN